ncbi:MAG TPA: hypothetical protein VGB54_02435 [Allosphingosinicella sp.]|jgi:hypothetical protein
MAQPTFLDRVLASWSGQVANLPTVEALLTAPTPADAVAELNELANTVRMDLAALELAVVAPDNITPRGYAVLAGQFGWLVETLRSWSPAADPEGRRMTAAMLAATRWDAHDTLWSLIRPLVANWSPAIEGMVRLLGQRQLQATISPDARIWEREHLAALQDADRRQDWSKLIATAPAFQVPDPDPAALQAARALWELDPARLVLILDSKTTWLDAAVLLKALPLAAALKAAALSNNGHARFAVLDGLMRLSPPDLPQGEAEALEELLVTLAKDERSWVTWMQAFNRYPPRAPWLQRPLGRALAASSHASSQAYVDSIELTRSDAGRLLVARCLSEFRQAATEGLRQSLWQRARERWADWNFEEAEGAHLADVGRSELDYAVVGWLIECAGLDEIVAETAAFEKAFKETCSAWHSSTVAMRSAINRLLSRYQLVVHAIAVGTTSDEWLPGETFYVPDAYDDPYVQARHPLPTARAAPFPPEEAPSRNAP